MARAISKTQIADLWYDELRPESNPSGCILCGGSSFIDTRGKVFDRTGRDAGGQAYCICPLGRSLKRHRDRQKARHDPLHGC